MSFSKLNGMPGEVGAEEREREREIAFEGSGNLDLSRDRPPPNVGFKTRRFTRNSRYRPQFVWTAVDIYSAVTFLKPVGN